MKIDITNACPSCDSTEFSTFYDVQSGTYKYSCTKCNQIWEYENPYVGLKVKITHPLSPWKGMVGVIQEIRNDPKYNVRVQFVVNKQTMGDLFNSAYLERVK